MPFDKQEHLDGIIAESNLRLGDTIFSLAGLNVPGKDGNPIFVPPPVRGEIVDHDLVEDDDTLILEVAFEIPDSLAVQMDFGDFESEEGDSFYKLARIEVVEPEFKGQYRHFSRELYRDIPGGFPSLYESSARQGIPHGQVATAIKAAECSVSMKDGAVFKVKMPAGATGRIVRQERVRGDGPCAPVMFDHLPVPVPLGDILDPAKFSLSRPEPLSLLPQDEPEPETLPAP